MIDEHAGLLVWFGSDIAYAFNADMNDPQGYAEVCTR